MPYHKSQSQSSSNLRKSKHQSQSHNNSDSDTSHGTERRSSRAPTPTKHHPGTVLPSQDSRRTLRVETDDSGIEGNKSSSQHQYLQKKRRQTSDSSSQVESQFNAQKKKQKQKKQKSSKKLTAHQSSNQKTSNKSAEPVSLVCFLALCLETLLY